MIDRATKHRQARLAGVYKISDDDKEEPTGPEPKAAAGPDSGSANAKAQSEPESGSAPAAWDEGKLVMDQGVAARPEGDGEPESKQAPAGNLNPDEPAAVSGERRAKDEAGQPRPVPQGPRPLWRPEETPPAVEAPLVAAAAAAPPVAAEGPSEAVPAPETIDPGPPPATDPAPARNPAPEAGLSPSERFARSRSLPSQQPGGPPVWPDPTLRRT
jgi:hypothetical protein